jgi:hypothetical protein
MLQPYNITLYVYAEDEQEAKALEQDLLDFTKEKYSQGIYPRAASLSTLVKRYGSSMLINNFIR